MKARLDLIYLRATLFALALATAAGAQSPPAVSAPAPTPIEISIDAAHPGTPINPHIYGQTIELTDRRTNGGIWAEMLEDRKFYYPLGVSGTMVLMPQNSTPAEVPAMSPWKVIGPLGTVEMVEKDAYVGMQSPQITAPGGHTAVGIFQENLGLVAGKMYTGYIVLAGDWGVGPVAITLWWGEGNAGHATQTISHITSRFARVPFYFAAGGNTEHGRLIITTSGKGKLRIGCVSLMPADNVDGFRKDALDLLKQLNSPFYRWPGGNFLSGRDWRDGVGERDKRSPRPGANGAGVEANDAGLDEFLHLCNLLGAEPVIAVGVGSGDASVAAEEVEYVNGASSTLMGKLRRKYGHPKPYGVKWWCVGGETFDSPQAGKLDAAQYAVQYNKVEEAMRRADPTIKTVAMGVLGAWSPAMLTNCGSHMNLIGESLVCRILPNVEEYVGQVPAGIRAMAETQRQYLREIPALRGRDIRVAVEDWNYTSGPAVPGEAGRRACLEDALAVAAGLHEFFRNSDIIDMANYGQSRNAPAAVLTTKSAAELEASAFALLLYRAQFGTRPLPVENPAAPADIAAALTSDGKYVSIGVVNPGSKPVPLQLNLKSARIINYGQAWLILGPHPPDPMAFNQPGEKRHLDLLEYPANVSWPVTIPACSIAVLRFPVELEK